MKLDKSNLYVKEKDNYFTVCIEIPDGSRNYIHSDNLRLQDCLMLIDELSGSTIEDDFVDPVIADDGTYFRIYTTYSYENSVFNFDIVFHSRKLNLNDAVSERNLLVSDESGD